MLLNHKISLASSNSSTRKRAGSVVRATGLDASSNASPVSKSEKNPKVSIVTREGRSNTVSERPSLGSAVADSFLSGSPSTHRQQITRSISTWNTSRDNGLISGTADSDGTATLGRKSAKVRASVELAEVKVQGSPSPRIAERAANYLKNASSASLALGSRAAIRDGRAQTVSYGNSIPLAEIEDDFFPPSRGPRRTTPPVCLDFNDVTSVFGNLDNIKHKSSSRKSLQRSSSTAPSKRSSLKRSSSRRTTENTEESSGGSPKKSSATRSRSNSVSVSDLSSPTPQLPSIVEITQASEGTLKSSKRSSSKRSSEKRKLRSSQSVAELAGIAEPQTPTPALEVSDVLSLLKSSPVAEQVEISSEKTSRRSSEKRLKSSADSERSDVHKSRRRSATITDSPSSSQGSSSGTSTPSSTASRSPKKKQSKMIVLTAEVPSVKDLTSSEASEESSPSTPHSSRQSLSSESDLQPMSISRSISVSPRISDRQPKETPEETPDAAILGSLSRWPQSRPTLTPISFETIAGLVASAGESGLVTSN